MKKLLLKFRNLIRDKYPLFWPLVRAAATVVLHQISKRRIRSILKTNKTFQLELGAGYRKGRDGWITLDISGNADLYWDVLYGIPFPNGSVTKIYSSHFFEHLSFHEIQFVLDECKRVLSPGGVFSICVPNARLYIDAYMTSKTLDEETFIIYKPGYYKTTKIDYVNYTAYMGGRHKYMFDEENLIYLLRSKGFNNARLRSFDPQLDLSMHDYESIYAEAEK